MSFRRRTCHCIPAYHRACPLKKLQALMFLADGHIRFVGAFWSTLHAVFCSLDGNRLTYTWRPSAVCSNAPAPTYPAVPIAGLPAPSQMHKLEVCGFCVASEPACDDLRIHSQAHCALYPPVCPSTLLADLSAPASMDNSLPPESPLLDESPTRFASFCQGRSKASRSSTWRLSNTMITEC
jgi:hypothetical protein